MAQRFYGEFADDQGDEWRINIYDDEYSLSTSEVTLSAEGFVLSYEGNQSDPFQRIIPSKVTFGAYIKSSAAFESWIEDDIVQRGESQVKIAIYKDPDGDNTLYWAGIVLVDQITIPDEFDAFVQFTASDGLALLTRDTETRSVAPLNEHLAQLIAKNPIAEFWSTGNGFVRYVNDYESLGYSGTDFLDDAQVAPPLNHSDLSFTGDPQEFNTYQKLEGLLSAFNMRLFQAEGYWYALPLSYYEQIKDGSNPSTIYRQVDKTGANVTLTFNEASYLNNNKILEDGVDFNRMSGGETMHLNAKKSTRITRRSANQQFLHRDIHPLEQFAQATTHISGTNGLTYSDDTAFLIEASNTWSRSPDPDIAGDAALVTLKLRTTLKAGTYYWNGSAWTTTSSTFDIDVFTFLRDSGQIELVEIWNYQTLPLGNEADELIFQGTWKFINGVGTDVTADMTNGILGWNVLLKIAGQTTILDFTYTAETTEENYDDVTLADTLFGSYAPLSAFANLNGTIKVGLDYPEDYQGYLWGGGPSAGDPLLTRVTDDALRMVQFPLKVRRNSYLHAIPNMWQVIKQGSTYWAPLRISIVMNTRRSNIERYIIDFDGANISGDSGPTGTPDDIGSAGFSGTDAVTLVNGQTGTVVLDGDDIAYDGSFTVNDLIDANTSNIDNLKSYVVSATDKVDLREDANNKVTVDGTSTLEAITLTVDGTDVFKVNDSEVISTVATEAPTLEANTFAGGLILTDSTGTRWRVQVQTDGTLRTTSW